MATSPSVLAWRIPGTVWGGGAGVGRGAWWAAVYGVAQSWTRLKQLSSSSSSQYSCLKNSMDRGAWWATVHEVTESQT